MFRLTVNSVSLIKLTFLFCFTFYLGTIIHKGLVSHTNFGLALNTLQIFEFKHGLSINREIKGRSVTSFP